MKYKVETPAGVTIDVESENFYVNEENGFLMFFNEVYLKHPDFLEDEDDCDELEEADVDDDNLYDSYRRNVAAFASGTWISVLLSEIVKESQAEEVK